MNLNYSQYLFSCLLKIYDKKFSELEYDLQFEQLPILYGEYESSKFDDPLKGEYECILAYLKDKYPNADKEAIIRKIQAIVREYGSFTTADIEASCDVSIPSIGNHIHLASFFKYDSADVDVYNDGDENEIDQYNLSYWDMDIDTLTEVLEYANQYEAVCLQDEDRQA
jgi:hypothetical protein